MAISRLNAEQFAQLGAKGGVTLEYAGKDGNNSAIAFFGADFEPKAKTQDEVLRVVKNVMLAHWTVKDKETVLRADNDGIRCKLRATTPYRIHIYTDNGEKIKVYDLADSEWAKIGLMPTKKDLERSTRDQKQYIHKASIAMLEALNFRLELPKEEKADKPQKAEKAERAIDKALTNAKNAAEKEVDTAKVADKPLEKAVAAA